MRTTVTVATAGMQGEDGRRRGGAARAISAEHELWMIRAGEIGRARTQGLSGCAHPGGSRRDSNGHALLVAVKFLGPVGFRSSDRGRAKDVVFLPLLIGHDSSGDAGPLRDRHTWLAVADFPPPIELSVVSLLYRSNAS